MAPTTNSSKSVQHNRPRQAASKVIVPAIPLPYIQKKKQQLAAREKVKEEPAQAQIVEPEPASTPPVAEIIPAVVNGSSDDHASDKTTEAPEADVIVGCAEPAISAAPVVKEEVQNAQEIANEEQESEEVEEVSVQQVPAEEVKQDERPETQASAPSDPPSSASRSTFHMPPAFVPANHNSQNNITDSVKFAPPNMFNGHYPLHHTHPSTGSLVFGGYPESNNSSPAPPPSAGNAPPYPYQQQPQIARHGPHLSNGSHTQHMPNGFSHVGPPAPPGYYPRQENFMNQGHVQDNYARRQMVSFGPPDGYYASPTLHGFDPKQSAYDPSTPHSFHGSQSSVPNEQENTQFYGQHPTAVISNGSNGHIDEVRLFQPPRPKPRSDSQQLAPATQTQGNYIAEQQQVDQVAVDNYDGLLFYLQNQFADAELADYVLELRYSDDHAPPVRIPGHNLMFARSPKLKALMQAQAQESNGLTVKSLFIESNDRFLRSDGFWMAVQRLYGGPLLDLGAAAIHNLPRNVGQTAPVAGTPAERFDLALGYAAAGHILGIPPVIGRGIEIAGMLVNWDTVEKALDFALDGGLESQWIFDGQQEQPKSTSTYGPNVNVLVFSALNFLVQAFPPNFAFDASVGEPNHNRRLPRVPDARPSSLNSRLSFIKFGDHPSEETVRSESGSAIAVTLSKILLNLPFYLLKYVLESPRLGNVEGWANNTLRQKVMHSVIEERERRRLKVLHSTYPPDRAKNTLDDTVRWQEAVLPHAGPEGTPALTRSWDQGGVSSSTN